VLITSAEITRAIPLESDPLVSEIIPETRDRYTFYEMREFAYLLVFVGILRS